jgi:hypothetical protein
MLDFRFAIFISFFCSVLTFIPMVGCCSLNCFYCASSFKYINDKCTQAYTCTWPRFYVHKTGLRPSLWSCKCYVFML